MIPFAHRIQQKKLSTKPKKLLLQINRNSSPKSAESESIFENFSNYSSHAN